MQWSTAGHSYSQFSDEQSTNYLCVCLGVLCAPCICVGAYRSQKRALDSLKLELQVTVSHQVGAENQT